ncbi:uncharacterized protein BDZ99DRAFT_41615 [Mytilinidion resinicola]|uniref:Uncharacterized protein n=1 Tax=Mytilinidion resinicola TaxID=574789 RepID=A0A6A6YJB0_9PEZI|nr:uncharacterized protein BDZ99DRAFT_41615 [Mytilinidion resinicola]KAF2808891.1 hypothetical protein BDZ99DRAFT_41615 [Mytilinidion resinicola]
MLRTLVRRAAEAPRPFNFASNPYKAKKIWPPNFDNMSQKHQFRLERRYKRRAKLAWARPRWTKGVKLAQNGIIIFVLVYGVLFMDWGREDTPFKGVSDASEQMEGKS